MSLVRQGCTRRSGITRARAARGRARAPHREQHVLQQVQRVVPGAALRVRGQQRVVRGRARRQAGRRQVLQHAVHLRPPPP